MRRFLLRVYLWTQGYCFAHSEFKEWNYRGVWIYGCLACNIDKKEQAEHKRACRMDAAQTRRVRLERLRHEVQRNA